MSTLSDWLQAARAVFADKPDWTAIFDSAADGYFVWHGGEVFAVARNPDPDCVYCEDDLIQLDSSAWENGAWDGMTPAQCREILSSPVFVVLPWQGGGAEQQADCGTVQYGGVDIALSQQPYLHGNGDSSWYQSTGIDSEGNEYLVKWDITNDAAEDASDTCDWMRYEVIEL